MKLQMMTIVAAILVFAGCSTVPGTGVHAPAPVTTPVSDVADLDPKTAIVASPPTGQTDLTDALTLEESTEREPYLYPVSVRGKDKTVPVISRFGSRAVPGKEVNEMHEGVDFMASVGAPVVASRAGKVIFSGLSKSYAMRSDKKQMGQLVILKHSDGMSTRYVHLATLKVRPPQEVQAGDVLGTVDASDEWSVPVLHFEVRDAAGTAMDPLAYLQAVK